MTEDEDARVIGMTIDVARGRAKVIAGAGSNSTASAIDYSKRARELGADAGAAGRTLVQQADAGRVVRSLSARIAEAVPDTPIMLYNVPGRTSSNIAAQTTLRLARDCENIVAVKEASGNLSQIHGNTSRAPDGFSVLSGDDAVTLPLIALALKEL
jgi:4-hydroxy-tetrahydrodipicolinate synthase